MPASSLRRRWMLPTLIAVATGGVAAGWGILSRPAEDPDRVWAQAQEDLRANRPDLAEEALRRLARLRVPSPRDRMLDAQVAMARGRKDEALAALASIPDDHPLAPQARLLAGQLELRRSRLRPAESALLAALALDPRLVQPRRELIYLYGIQLRRAELNAQFRALAELTPLTFDNVFHWCLTRNTIWEPLEIIQIMSRFLAADPGDRWSRLALAEGLRQVGRRAESAEALAPLPATDPDARAIRVRLALDRGDDRAAEALLAEGPEDHPELARLRGRFALARREGDAALRHFRAAYRAEPDNRDTLFGLAGSLTMVGDPEAAKPYFSLARNHDLLGSLMQRASIPSARDDPDLLRELGAACEAIQRFPEARAWYHLAITRDPLDKEAQQALHRLNAATAVAKKPTTGTSHPR